MIRTTLQREVHPDPDVGPSIDPIGDIRDFTWMSCGKEKTTVNKNISYKKKLLFLDFIH